VSIPSLRQLAFSRVCFWKVGSNARTHHAIAFARCRDEALPIKYCNFPSAARTQPGTLQLSGSIGDGWPLDTQHFGEQILSDLQGIIVTAVTHREQPTGQPLLEAVRPVARYRHQDLLEKGLGVSVHQASK
jgi:hypothetical protein